MADDFFRTKFDWGFRDVYKNGCGMLEYTKTDGRLFVIYHDNDGRNMHDVSTVKAGRSIIRDAYRAQRNG